METLFRLVLSRPPVAQDEEAPSIELSQDTEFQAALGQAQDAENAGLALKEVARAFTGSPAFVGTPTEVALHTELENFRARINALESEEKINKNAIEKIVEEVFGHCQVMDS